MRDAGQQALRDDLEAIRDPEGLRAVGELSARTGKPVFVMKTGTTERGQRAAAAHTGALATSDAVCDAAPTVAAKPADSTGH